MTSQTDPHPVPYVALRTEFTRGLSALALRAWLRVLGFANYAEEVPISISGLAKELGETHDWNLRRVFEEQLIGLGFLQLTDRKERRRRIYRVLRPWRASGAARAVGTEREACNGYRIPEHANGSPNPVTDTGFDPVAATGSNPVARTGRGESKERAKERTPQTPRRGKARSPQPAERIEEQPDVNQRTDDAALAAIIEPVPLATFRAWEQWARPTAPPWDSFAVKSRQHRELRYVLEGWNEFPRPEVWQLAFERSRIGTGPGKLRSGASGLLPALRAAAAELLARLPRPSPARAEACQSGGCGAKATFHAPDGGQLCGSHAKAIVDRGGLRWEELAEIGPTTSYGPRKCRPAPV